MSKILSNKKVTTILTTLIIPTIITLLLLAGFLNTWESKISDAMYSPTNTLDDIIIIAIDDTSLQTLGQWPWPRSYFAQVINTMNQSRVIGIDVSFFEPTEDDRSFELTLSENAVVLAMEYTAFSQKNNQLYGEELILPTTTLGKPGVNYSVGFVNLFIDSDGITRSFTPQIQGIQDHDHFSKVIAETYTGISQNLGYEKRLINLFAEPNGYTTISFVDVYNNEIEESYFDGKIVLIGATASNLHDDVQVPISNQAMPGVEVNANLVQSILTRDYIVYQDDVSSIILIFLFSIITALILYYFRIHISIISLPLIAVVFIYLSIILFDFGIIVNLLYPLFSMTTVFIFLIGYYYVTAEKNRKWITSVFGKYVSPVVIDTLIKNPSLINLGGERRDITVFFSDIRKFTSISESLKPEELVQLLNEYLTEMTTIILNEQGLVDKYMGDAIMAFWGAPIPQENHAEMACSSSLAMINALTTLQKKWKKEGIPSFNIGIGLNSGGAIVGNMGSENRFDYTAMGDTVNLASRLEGLNKYYGTTIIISEQTQNIITDKFETRKLDAVRVKGKKKPIHIYELLTTKSSSKKLVSYYEKGLDLYFHKKWDKAIESFQKALAISKDTPSTILIGRCKAFKQNPPPEDWDGVWEMKTK